MTNQNGILPMLAHRFDKHADKIQWPAYVQPKLDGHRCIAMIKEGRATLWSRTRKPITSMPHIVRALEALGVKDAILDGELYLDPEAVTFEKLTSLIRNQKPQKGHEAVQYHIYDVVNDKPFSERHMSLSTILERQDETTQCLLPVPTADVPDADGMFDLFGEFVAAGYEGAIVRNADGLYAQKKRSYDLQKVKTFDDTEFEIVGVKEGRGKLQGHGIFVCKTSEGAEFNAKMSGATTALKHFLAKPGDYIGRMLTVQHHGWTINQVPRFPVALRMREAL